MKNNIVIIGVIVILLLSSFFVIPGFGLHINKEISTNNINNSPSNSLTWKKTFGGFDWDYGNYVQQTNDGGYIVIGETYSWRAGGRSEDIYVIKTNQYGNKVWSKIFGIHGIEREWGQSIQQTEDGGYIITGMKGAFLTTWFDLWLIKLDSKGTKEWDICYAENGFDWGNDVKQTNDGGYIIVGCTESYGAGGRDVWLIKTDGNGEEIWKRTFGGTGWDNGYSIEQTIDEGFIITGYTKSFGNGDYDLWLIKTDENGEELWNKTFGGSNEDIGKSVQQTTDGGYIITGHTNSFGNGKADVLFIKTDEEGDIIWNQTYGGNDNDYGRSIQQTSDGGCIIAGSVNGYYRDENADMLLIKTDENGNIIWYKQIGGPQYDDGRSVQQTSDGGYIITGETRSYGRGSGDVWLVKTDENGDSRKTRSKQLKNIKSTWFEQFSNLIKIKKREIVNIVSELMIEDNMFRNKYFEKYVPLAKILMYFLI